MIMVTVMGLLAAFFFFCLSLTTHSAFGSKILDCDSAFSLLELVGKRAANALASAWLGVPSLYETCLRQTASVFPCTDTISCIVTSTFASQSADCGETFSWLEFEGKRTASALASTWPGVLILDKSCLCEFAGVFPCMQ